MNTLTVVTQLINQAKMRHGAVEAIEVPDTLWEPAMDEVAAAGGRVGLDHCVVDGVEVHRSGEPQGARVRLPSGETRPLDLG